jgi:hypothetical protein
MDVGYGPQSCDELTRSSTMSITSTVSFPITSADERGHDHGC